MAVETGPQGITSEERQSSRRPLLTKEDVYIGAAKFVSSAPFVEIAYNQQEPAGCLVALIIVLGRDSVIIPFKIGKKTLGVSGKFVLNQVKHGVIGWANFGINVLRRQRGGDLSFTFSDNIPEPISETRDVVEEELYRIVNNGFSQSEPLPDNILSPDFNIENSQPFTLPVNVISLAAGDSSIHRRVTPSHSTINS